MAQAAKRADFDHRSGHLGEAGGTTTASQAASRSAERARAGVAGRLAQGGRPPTRGICSPARYAGGHRVELKAGWVGVICGAARDQGRARSLTCGTAIVTRVRPGVKRPRPADHRRVCLGHSSRRPPSSPLCAHLAARTIRCARPPRRPAPLSAGAGNKPGAEGRAAQRQQAAMTSLWPASTPCASAACIGRRQPLTARLRDPALPKDAA